MTSARAEAESWSRRRWWGLVMLIFIIQLALIFWLGETSPIHRRPAGPGLTLRIPGKASAELLALRDPTLFVLPHPQEHPAPAWLGARVPAPHPFVWPEPTNPPLLAVDRLGAAFNQLIGMNSSLPQVPLPKPEPRLDIPRFPSQPIARGQSSVRLEGALAQRRLSTPLDLPSWPSRDLLTNSVVRLLVDAGGLPQSAILLSSSGSREADQFALDQARSARFEPLSRNPAGPTADRTAQLSWGKLVFLWHTIPQVATNAPTLSP